MIKPVYMINGFLDAGKTEFIRFTLDQPYFQTRGKTLLIVCEEGENEYTEAALKRAKCDIEYIESEEDFTPEKLAKIEKAHKADRIIIEFNGMWNAKDLKLPWYWKVEQQITIIDGSTFSMYFTNMRALLANMLRESEMIIMNRCDDIRDELAVYRRNIKAVNQNADVIFEDSQGEIDEIFEDDLPYDLQKDTIELIDDAYGIWFLDCQDHMDRYAGKVIEFDALVMKPEALPDGYIIPGRMAMTCCADDMAFLGYACEYKDSASINDKDWVHVKATVDNRFFEGYEGEGPYLTAIEVKKTDKPKNDVISFS